MPKKTFTAGEVLAAADVNDFLMDQSLMTFAGTAARGSAIPTPVEGMLTYLDDSDIYESYSGSAWLPALPMGAWQSYTPTFTGFTLGDGTIEVAKYSQIGNTVHCKVQVTLGSTSAVTGSITIGLPVSANNDYNSAQGVSKLIAGGVLGTGIVAVNTPTTARLFPLLANGTYVTNTNTTATVPGTWASGSSFAFFITYEAA
jgi:hypothetical protein